MTISNDRAGRLQLGKSTPPKRRDSQRQWTASTDLLQDRCPGESIMFRSESTKRYSTTKEDEQLQSKQNRLGEIRYAQLLQIDLHVEKTLVIQ